jgi:hypothetical protein
VGIINDLTYFVRVTISFGTNSTLEIKPTGVEWANFAIKSQMALIYQCF